MLPFVRLLAIRQNIKDPNRFSRIAGFVLLCLCFQVWVGCQMTNSQARKDADLLKNQEGGIKEEPDPWGFVGKEGRGRRQLDDERDPLNGILMSKEARDIERNLGYK
jgi:hypothetical protein